MAKEEIRLNIRASGQFLAKIREVAELCALRTESDAARFLIGRGLEAMNPQLQQARLYQKLEQQYDPQELLPFLSQLEKGEPFKGKE